MMFKVCSIFIWNICYKVLNSLQNTVIQILDHSVKLVKVDGSSPERLFSSGPQSNSNDMRQYHDDPW